MVDFTEVSICNLGDDLDWKKGRMDACTSAAAEVNIRDDLVMKILSRLPPKPLVVCKCVSKSWHRLVSTLIHYPTRPRPITGLLVNLRPVGHGHRRIEFFNIRDDEIDVDYSLSFLPCHLDTRLLDYRDGFLLCSSENEGEQDTYFVCNPITGQWVSLPHPPQRSSEMDVNAYLVFDEESDLYCYHFKVVRFFTLYDGENPESSEDEDEEYDLYVDIYSSQTGKWEESKDFIEGINFDLSHRPSLYLNGVLFLCNSRFYYLLYDVKEEYCKVLNLPFDWYRTYLRFNCFAKSEGCLHYSYNVDSKMKVWIIQDGITSEWVLKHSINLADIVLPGTSEEEDYVWGEKLKIIAFHPNLDAIFIRDAIDIRKKLDFFCYNFNTKVVETVVCNFPKRTSDMDLCPIVFYPFTDCLYPLADAHAAQQRT